MGVKRVDETCVCEISQVNEEWPTSEVCDVRCGSIPVDVARPALVVGKHADAVPIFNAGCLGRFLHIEFGKFNNLLISQVVALYGGAKGSELAGIFDPLSIEHFLLEECRLFAVRVLQVHGDHCIEFHDSAFP